MKTFKVEGTIYYEGEVTINDEDETLKDYRESIDSSADLEKIAGRIVLNSAIFEEDFIEGIGKEGKQFSVKDPEWWLDDSNIEEVQNG